MNPTSLGNLSYDPKNDHCWKGQGGQEVSGFITKKHHNCSAAAITAVPTAENSIAQGYPTPAVRRLIISRDDTGKTSPTKEKQASKAPQKGNQNEHPSLQINKLYLEGRVVPGQGAQKLRSRPATGSTRLGAGHRPRGRKR